MKFLFGKHKGKDILEVETKYLEWCAENLDPKDILTIEINIELKRRREQITGTPTQLKLPQPTEDYIVNCGPKFREEFTKSLARACADNINGREFFYAQFPNGKRVKFRFMWKDIK